MVRLETGLVIPRVRERNAPRAGFGAQIGGWLEWALVDRRGRAVRGGQCRNLWLDQGLDQLAVPSSAGTSILGRGNQSGAGAALYGITHAAVGTGSTPVDPAQTALAAELARTSTVLGSPTATRTADGVYELSKAFVFDFNQANGNLTEWGMARAATLGLLTRALFVDGSGNPITITKTSDYQLRIIYTLELTLTPVTPQPASITVSGIGPLNGQAMLTAGTNGGGMNDLVFFNDWAAGGAHPQAGLSTDTTLTYLGNTQFASASAGANVNTPSAYATGSFERSCNHTWGVNNGNLSNIRTIAGSGYINGGFRVAGFIFLVDPGGAFTKTNSNQLVLNDLFTVAWGRA